MDLPFHEGRGGGLTPPPPHEFLEPKKQIQLIEVDPTQTQSSSSATLALMYLFTCISAGIPWDSDIGVELAKQLDGSAAVSFQGIYTHEGGSYSAKNEKDVKAVGAQTTDRLLTVAARYFLVKVLYSG